MRDQNKIRGCLLGGAIGDAFGYPVEYLDFAQIQTRYGENGILGYDLTNGFAEISDNMQMALFTANGLLLGKTMGFMKGKMGPYAAYITAAYLDWLKTQRLVRPDPGYRHRCWLYEVPELHHRRHPDTTCLQMLTERTIGTIEQACNSTKGAIGAARVAPIGAFFDPHHMAQTEIDRLGAEAAAITHGHPTSWICAAAVVHLINCIIYCGATHADWKELLEDTIQAITHGFSSYSPEAIINQLKRGYKLASSKFTDRQVLDTLGDGTSGDSVLAMAIFCAVRYGTDFEGSIIAAVNHNGDSSAVGTICGSLQGAMLGAAQLPEYDLEPLELREVIDEIAVDLWCDCRMRQDSNFYDEDWARKYLEARYRA